VSLQRTRDDVLSINGINDGRIGRIKSERPSRVAWKVYRRSTMRNATITMKCFSPSEPVKQSPCGARRAHNARYYRPYKETSRRSKLVSSIADPFVRRSYGARALIDIARDGDNDSSNERIRPLRRESKQMAWNRLVNFTTPPTDDNVPSDPLKRFRTRVQSQRSNDILGDFRFPFRRFLVLPRG